MDVVVSWTTPGAARLNSNLFKLQMNKSTEGPEKETDSRSPSFAVERSRPDTKFLKIQTRDPFYYMPSSETQKAFPLHSVVIKF